MNFAGKILPVQCLLVREWWRSVSSSHKARALGLERFMLKKILLRDRKNVIDQFPQRKETLA